MRSAAAEISGDTEDVVAIHSRRIRRSKVMRSQNVWLTEGKECLRSFALEIANHALRNILNVERAFAQIRIIDFAQRLGIARSDFLERPLHVAKIGLKFSQNFIN